MEQKQTDEQSSALDELEAPVHELTAEEAAQVEGGARTDISASKGGGTDSQYLKVKLSDILISS